MGRASLPNKLGNIDTPRAWVLGEEPSDESGISGPPSGPSGVRPIATPDAKSAFSSDVLPRFPLEGEEADAWGAASTESEDDDNRPTPLPGEPQQDRTMVPGFDLANYARKADETARPPAQQMDIQVDFVDEPGDCTRTASTADEMHREMYQRFLESDYPAAQTLAESLLELSPENSLALAVLEKCKEELDGGPVSMSRFGLEPHDKLQLTIGPNNLRLLPLDPTTMFVLSQLDGQTDLETVFTMTGIVENQVTEKLVDLFRRGILQKVL
jgi:hypothetical protein